MDRKLLFQASDISKQYPGTLALDGVSLEIYEGEILGLVGENGAGKSTLFKIINGVEKATTGSMKMHGEKYEPKNPKDANTLGVGMVFQEQSIVTNLTVGQNIFFAKEKEFKRLGVFINWRKMYKRAAEILEDIDITDIPPEKKAGDLNFAKRQMVEIAKVLNSAKSKVNDKCIILLDEPTSVLGDTEIKQLYKEMRKLKEEGNCVIFVSHRLDEVLEITDRIYVFKDGQNVGEIETSEADENKIYQMMVGKSGTGEYYKINQQNTPKDKVIFSAKGLYKKGVFRDVSFDLHEGEILSIAGVVGSGKEDVCSVITGDDVVDGGVMTLEGEKVHFGAPSSALKKGVLMVPKERREEGILGTRSIYENISLSNLKRVTKNGVYWETTWSTAEDIKIKDFEYYAFHQTLDDRGSGYAISKAMFDQFDTPGEGKVLAIQGMLANSAAINRFKGLEDALAEYPGVELLDDQAGDWDPQKAYTIAETWLSKYDDIAGIWVANDSMALAVVELLEAKGLIGDVKVVGVDGIPDAVTAIQEGKMTATVYSDPYKQGGGSLAYLYQIWMGNIAVSSLTDEQRCFLTEGVLVTADTVDAFANSTPEFDYGDPQSMIYKLWDISAIQD